jgi:hypothetical protein
VNALNGLGRVHCRKRDFRLAEMRFRDALDASVQIEGQKPWLRLNLAIALLDIGAEHFSAADDNLSQALKEFSRRTKQSKKKHTHIGTHSLYHYSIGLVLANSPKYKEVLKNAVRWCSGKGLRDEILGDIEMIEPEAWHLWADYAVARTSEVPLGAGPGNLIAYLT